MRKDTDSMEEKVRAILEILENRYPESMCALHYDKDYELIYHIPNEGKRKRRTGGNLVKAGLKKGVPDICVPVSKLGMNGLYIELKKDKSGDISKEQIEWIKRLSKQKYLATVCYGADEAIELITAYMQSDSNKLLTVYRHIQEDGKTGRIDFKNVLDE